MYLSAFAWLCQVPFVLLNDFKSCLCRHLSDKNLNTVCYLVSPSEMVAPTKVWSAAAFTRCDDVCIFSNQHLSKLSYDTNLINRNGSEPTNSHIKNHIHAEISHTYSSWTKWFSLKIYTFVEFSSSSVNQVGVYGRQLWNLDFIREFFSGIFFSFLFEYFCALWMHCVHV